MGSQGNKTTKSQLHLLPLTNAISATEVLAVSSAKRVYACDFAIIGAEKFTEQPWGYEDGRLANIDHHAPTPRMRARISSANLALIYVRERGVATSDEAVVINHTDCDSILSSAIMRGDLESLEIFGDAAIAADHTGEASAIADLLQALNKKRDYEYSLRNLHLLLDERELDEEAADALKVRHAKRKKAAQLVESGAFAMQNGIAWAELDSAIDGEFFPALLPEAVLIAMFISRSDAPEKWNAKFRLGNAAPANFSLPSVIAPFDAGYGGRWNAGSNTRAGGSAIAPREYVAAIAQAMQK
jgi:hypothetical protein